MFIWNVAVCLQPFYPGSVASEDCMEVLEFDLLKLIRWGCSETDHDNKCAEKKIGQIREWLQNSKYRILVTGRMGSGKTTFIRGLTENFVPPKESLLPRTTTDSLLPHTTTVMPYGHYYEGSNCVFFDTPGLKDNEESSNDYDYLREMVRKNGEPDLLVFAIKMDDFVFRDEDVESMVNISSAFGWQIWQRALFILTFANVVSKVGHTAESIENKLHFSNVVTQRHWDIVEALRRNLVKEEVINNIAVVPVGLVSQPNIPADRHEVPWNETFWQEAFKIFRETRTSTTPMGRTTPTGRTIPMGRTSPASPDKAKKEGMNKAEYTIEDSSIISSILSCLLYVWFVIASVIAALAILGFCLDYFEK